MANSSLGKLLVFHLYTLIIFHSYFISLSFIVTTKKPQYSHGLNIIIITVVQYNPLSTTIRTSLEALFFMQFRIIMFPRFTHTLKNQYKMRRIESTPYCIVTITRL